MRKVVPTDAVLIPEGAQKVFEGVIYDVYQWQQQLFDGSFTTFEMLRRPDTVVAIGIVDDKVLMLRDMQPHRGVRMTFPGGRLSADESSLAGVKRELHEETGYEFKNWRLVHVMQPQVKLEWFIYVYLAWDGVQTSRLHQDAGEKIVISLLPFEQAKPHAVDNIYNAETAKLFGAASSTQDLLALPDFVGKEVEISL